MNGKHARNSGTLEISLPYSQPLTLQYARTFSDEISLWIDAAGGEHARLSISGNRADLEYGDGYDSYTGSAEWTDKELHARLYDEEELLFMLDAGMGRDILTIDASTADQSEVLRLVYDNGSLFARYDDDYEYAQLDISLREGDYSFSFDRNGYGYSAGMSRINGKDILRICIPGHEYSFSIARLHDGKEYSTEIHNPMFRFDAALSLREKAISLAWNHIGPQAYTTLAFTLKPNPHGEYPGMFAQLDFNGEHWTLEYAPGKLTLENRHSMLILEDTASAYAPNRGEITITSYDIRNSIREPGDTPLYIYRISIENSENRHSFTLSDESGKLGSLTLDFAPDVFDLLAQGITWISARDLEDFF